MASIDHIGVAEYVRTARRDRGLTRAELARRAGISLSSVKAYERGARHPGRAAVSAIALALGLPGEQERLLINLAGFASDVARRVLAPRTLDELRDETGALTWPAFVSNQAMDVVVWNDRVERLFDVDTSSEFTRFGERNFLVRIADERFASRMENWDEVVRFLAGLAKGDPRFTPDYDRPLPWFEVPIARVLQGDPARVTRLLALWDEATPIPPALRFRVPIRFRASNGDVLSFSGITMLEDPVAELHWNEWLPADERTWAWCAAR